MTKSIAYPHRASTDDVEHIAALVANIRPNWDSSVVRIVLLAHADQVDASDLAVAAIRAAANPDLPVPKAIGWRGPHWDNAVTVPVDNAPRVRCFVCGKYEAQCYGTRPGPDDHKFEPPPAGAR